MASCTVATLNCANCATTALSARTMPRLTMPSRLFSDSFIILLQVKSTALGRQDGVEAREHPARITFINQRAVGIAENRRAFDIALGVVVMVAGLRIDAAYGADHLRGEQHVFYRNDGIEQIDTGLVVDAGIEENIAQQMLFQQRFFHLLRQAAKASPVIRHRA